MVILKFLGKLKETPFYLLIPKIFYKLFIKIKNYYCFKKSSAFHRADSLDKLYLKNFKYKIWENFSPTKINDHDNRVFGSMPDIKYFDELVCLNDKAFIIDNLVDKHKIVLCADSYCNHVFNLLGSGETIVSYGLKADGLDNIAYIMNSDEKKITDIKNRTKRKILDYFKGQNYADTGLMFESDYEPIDWHVDFKSGYRWSNKEWFKKIKAGPAPGADIKVPWELSRLYHFLTLGQAYFITGDEKYTKEYISQFLDWVENNTFQYGANWSCSMEAAIRACNLILSFNYFKNSKLINSEFIYEFTKSIYLHGLHIKNNLEKEPFGPVTNHYLADLAGLAYIGRFLEEIKFGQSCLKFAITELKKQIQKQIHEDGSDYEASICYHRLVLELLFFPMVLLVKTDAEFNDDNYKEIACKIFGENYVNRVFKMFEVIKNILNYDNSIPQIGDNDNGRLHIYAFSKYQDVKYLLDLASVFFKETNFKILDSGNNSIKDSNSDAIIWVYGKEGKRVWESLNGIYSKNRKSISFIDSGWFIMRKNNSSVIISAGPNGQANFGGHAHNDKLGFELILNNTRLFADPGTYLYTASDIWRNLFRSTSFHNTVEINGEEQNRFLEKSIFLLKNDAKVKINKFITTEEYDFFDAEHCGYMRFKSPVIHRRQILFLKDKIRIFVKDIIKGNGNYFIEVFFHLDSNVKFDLNNDEKSIVFNNIGNEKYKLLNINNMDCSIEKGWISPGYGEKVESAVIKYVKNIESFNESLFVLADETFRYTDNMFENFIKDLQ